MEKLYSFIRNFKLPKKYEITSAIFSFSKKEWTIFSIFLIVFLFTTLAMLKNINTSFMVSVPMKGGTISEGIVGTPRFINPVLALSDADRNLVSLIYSGLMRKDGNGTLILDLAEKHEVSKDGLTHTFVLKKNIYFHDEKIVTADDILFTINEVKDPIIKSPRKGNWDGVTAEKIDNQTIKFILKQPYASFLENTTLPIMPAHIWSGSKVELNDANTNPIGSGPYKVSNITKSSTGTINTYELTRFKNFILEKPFIQTITLKFYSNEDNLIEALTGGAVDQISSITPQNAKILKNKNYQIESSVLPRIFGLFFNQNQNQIFTDKKIILAIDQAINKEQIVKEVLGGYGVIINDPIPPNIVTYQKLTTENIIPHEQKLIKAQEILTKDGWKKNNFGFLEKTITDKKTKKKVIIPLEFSISTGNAEELVKSAELIKQDLGSIGIKVDIKTFEVGNLNQSVIRPRKYDALLFGQIINHESDLFAFWHSTQRKDPGLNVAMYTNARVDKILEDAFVTIDEKSRIKKYAQFEDEIRKDMPAVFLYSPNFIYVVAKNLKGLNVGHVTSPANRFSNVYEWYIEEDNVWKMFAQ